MKVWPFNWAGIGSTSGTATTSTGAGGSGSGWACTGSSSEITGGGLPCVAQPANKTVEASRITGNAVLRKRSFMAWLLRKNPKPEERSLGKEFVSNGKY